MLKNILNKFRIVEHTNNSSRTIKLNTLNNSYYALFTILVKLTVIVIKHIQQNLISVYTVWLQTNRLPFRVLPQILKNWVTWFAWNDEKFNFYSRVKNYNNFIIRRIQNNFYIHVFWTLFFTKKINYFNELNSKKQFEKKISNYYYTTKFQKNLVLTYFLNKVILSKYMYFYGHHYYNFNKFNINETLLGKSVHIRSQIFFILLNKLNLFVSQTTNSSFEKITLNTFKGMHNFFFTLNKKKIYFVDKKRTVLDDIRTKTITHSNNNTFISIKLITVKTKLVSFVTPIFNNLNIMWFNKIHNTIHDCKKNTLICYLRVAKHFNKGRYSRNRQLYRTGVYWCIWLNVVIVYSLYYYFYRVVFAFGYLWLPLCIMMLSIFGSRLYKYRYYTSQQLKLELLEYNKFLFNVYTNFQVIFSNKFLTITKKTRTNLKNYFEILKQKIKTNLEIFTKF